MYWFPEVKYRFAEMRLAEMLRIHVLCRYVPVYVYVAFPYVQIMCSMTVFEYSRSGLDPDIYLPKLNW